MRSALFWDITRRRVAASSGGVEWWRRVVASSATTRRRVISQKGADRINIEASTLPLALSHLEDEGSSSFETSQMSNSAAPHNNTENLKPVEATNLANLLT
jgi:hypothetical protein